MDLLLQSAYFNFTPPKYNFVSEGSEETAFTGSVPCDTSSLSYTEITLK